MANPQVHSLLPFSGRPSERSSISLSPTHPLQLPASACWRDWLGAHAALVGRDVDHEVRACDRLLAARRTRSTRAHLVPHTAAGRRHRCAAVAGVLREAAQPRLVRARGLRRAPRRVCGGEVGVLRSGGGECEVVCPLAPRQREGRLPQQARGCRVGATCAQRRAPHAEAAGAQPAGVAAVGVELRLAVLQGHCAEAERGLPRASARPSDAPHVAERADVPHDLGQLLLDAA
mmetsp:Transcript_10573/g.26648  ORF Transcript_10573/g.26648 Transcript_10573/m.26648 type:complete len:232 (+) Transcript_10573:124-819(+)